MFPWPHLELDENERKYVSYYAAKGKPGVLRRVYQVELASTAIPNATPPILAPRFDDTVQIARRSRIFGLTFAGDVASWRLTIRTASGEAFTAFEPQTGKAPLASSMVPGTLYNANAFIGEPPTVSNVTVGNPPVAATLQVSRQYGALLIEPNWELMPNETLVFHGDLAETLGIEDTRFLSVGVHVWEFPGMAGREQS